MWVCFVGGKKGNLVKKEMAESNKGGVIRLNENRAKLSDGRRTSKAGRYGIWRTLFIILIVINIYCISFFFAFEPFFYMFELHNPGLRERTGPVGTTLVVPCSTRTPVQQALFYVYYPIHRFFKYKDWMWPLKNVDFIFEPDYEERQTQ